MKRISFSTLALTTLLAACVSPVATVEVNPIRYEDYLTFPSPRTLDKPGTVFRVTPDGIKLPVRTLTVVTEPGAVAFPVFEAEYRMSAGVFAGMLGAAGISVALAQDRMIVI